MNIKTMFHFFKKKKKPILETPITTFCIPGIWKERNEIVTAIAENNLNEYIFAGFVLLNLKNNNAFTLEICEFDSNLKELFKRVEGNNRISDAILCEIENTNFVAYLSFETKTEEDIKEIALAANAILKSGGVVVKIENTNIAFTKEDWFELSTEKLRAFLFEENLKDTN
ncbi:hypothetical protein [Aureivirga sp. CE67]|uniref:hypothetical protein n=1 Tax=Aureivirga sp. CE67 TaxID=1788983 RepID=UPI0018CA1C03|nr:hypothetical protein [Aureivirga sp. CE67]